MWFWLLVSDFQNIRRETCGSIPTETLTNVHQTTRRDIQKIKVPIFVFLTVPELLQQRQTYIYIYVHL